MTKTLRNEIREIVKEVLAEAMNPAECYALVAEDDGRFMGTYKNKEDAIEDAESMSQAAPGTSYRVCRCDKDGHFDYDDYVHTTFNEGKDWLMNHLRENIKEVVDISLRLYHNKNSVHD